ncbi:MAG: histidinol-phosphate transaminase [Armatimonadota bacterium]|nr:histidinol-phosphate transaminase [Armatimonadota bacterium]
MIRIDARRAARRGVPDLTAFVPEQPASGGPDEHGLDRIARLSLNESPFDLPAGMVQAILEEATALSRYPDATCSRLRTVLSARMGLPPECFVFGNGAEECIRLVAQAFLNEGDRVVIPAHAFDAYQTASRLCGAEVTWAPLRCYHLDLDQALRAVDSTTKMVWLTSPNNPTGTILRRDEFERFLDRVPDGVIVVLDQAYAEFADDAGHVRAEDYLFTDGRVVGLRTFSKAFGLAGVRIGYAIGHPSVIEMLGRVKLPFNVSVVAQSAALCVLREDAFVESHVRAIRAERAFLQEAMTARRLAVVPSHANFVFTELPVDGDALARLLQRAGVLVRSGSAFGLPRAVRVTVGAHEQNLRFLASLDDALAVLPWEG